MGNLTSLIPTMSSYTNGNITISYSSEYSSLFKAWMPFGEGNGWLCADGEKTKKPFIIINLGNVFSIGSYSIKPFVVASGGSYAKSWNVYYSSDGLSYTLLHSKTTSLPQESESFEDHSAGGIKAKYLKFEITDSFGSYGWTGFGKLKIYEFTPANKTLILHDGEYKKWNEGQKPIDEYVSTIPPLTSNTSSSVGEAFGDGYTVDYYQAFDGIDSTIWQGDKPTVGIIGFKYNKPLCISKYILANYTATTRFNPKNWTFEGSNDGISYTVLDTKKDVAVVNPSVTESTFNNSQNFLYYRFNITNIALADGTNRPHVHEIKLFEHKKESGIPSQWESVSSTSPSSTQFLEQGMGSLSPLLDRRITTLEPMPMIDKSEILGVGETGKVFSKTIDLKKYFDIKSIRTEVK